MYYKKCLSWKNFISAKFNISRISGKNSNFHIFSYRGPPKPELKMNNICMTNIKMQNTNQTGLLKESPLHLAVSKGHLEIVKLLMEYEVNKEPKNIIGETPLHYAASYGHLDIVKFLSDQEINLEPRDFKNETPLIKALKNGYLEIVKFFALKNYTKTMDENKKMCYPIQKIVFAKNQKTGGSTLQNIFIRYGLKHGLKFALPKNSRNFRRDSHRPKGVYSLYEKFHENMVMQFWWKGCKNYDLMLWYSIYNISEANKIIPKNDFSKRITILRDPVNTFESGYVYYDQDKAYSGLDINEFAEKISKNKFPSRKLNGKNSAFVLFCVLLKKISICMYFHYSSI